MYVCMCVRVCVVYCMHAFFFAGNKSTLFLWGLTQPLGTRLNLAHCFFSFHSQELEFWPCIQETTRKPSNRCCKQTRQTKKNKNKRGIRFPLFDSSRCVFSVAVTCLTNSGKSKRSNPRIIYSWAPVNPLMTFLMKVTSLQNGDCSFFFRLYCTERRWPEETNSTHFWTAVSSDSPPGSVATRAKIDACSWQIARTAIYMGEMLPGNVRGRVT